ncbi:hypothetical protein [Ligilactobacillus aviarius]|uniref:hypothetical protein n=1 Tax=Ligilactobacillus aviarius TaxID=1606 RepID=UPI0024B9BD32|nr:hypothetical protein [Ligilactobacillus aviarius]
MSETNKLVAAQLTNALLTNNSNLDKEHYSLNPVTVDDVTEIYKSFLNYLNSIS